MDQTDYCSQSMLKRGDSALTLRPVCGVRAVFMVWVLESMYAENFES